MSSLLYKGFLDTLLPEVDIVKKKKLENTPHANCQKHKLIWMLNCIYI